MRTAAPCLAFVLVLASLARAALAAPSVVKLSGSGEAVQLLVDGKPFFVQGAAGGGSLEALKAAGANTTRTWGVDNLQQTLDSAQKLGLKVIAGIWLGQERQGFRYTDPNSVAAQNEAVAKAVAQFKDHPALLAWGLGNEMEGAGDNAAVWSAIQNVAVLTKRLDPNHPTMTVIAELGGDKIRNLMRLCPDIDIVGINSYAGGATVGKRYRESGGTRPYILTEFGPAGFWEVGKTAWGAALEPTSAEKAALYRKTWEASVAKQPLCLGGIAFTWGHKQEATATWFGMLLPDGTRTPAVDTMQELWTGHAPANRCPAIATLKLESPDQVDPGATVKASLQASDPEGDPLGVQWVLQSEVARYGAGGDAEPTLPSYPQAVTRGDANGAEVKMPAEPGGYRLFAYVRDGKGGASVANLPILVKGTVKSVPAAAGKLPLTIYDEATRAGAVYTPSGWMGNTQAIKMDEAYASNPHGGKTCLRFDYTAADGWGGVVWQSPANDWGDLPGGLNLTGAKKLTFWARGEKGGEKVSFLFGLLGRDKKYADSGTAKLDAVALTADWKQYTLDLSGVDLTRVKTGFAWTAASPGHPITFYLDDIRWE